MTSKLSKSVLERIKKEEIKPLPKYYFVLRNVLWWFAFVFSILLGGAGLAVTAFAFMHQRFELADIVERGQFGAFIPLLPFFWILFFGVFIWASFWGIAHTKKAYRIPRVLLVFLNVFLTLLLGTVIYATRQAERFEHMVGKQMFHMPTVREARTERWKEGIDDGRLAGEIKEVLENELVVVSFNNKDWTVDISEADIHPDVIVEVGNKIGMRGEKTGEGVFKAEKMRPWDPTAPRPPRGDRGERIGERPLLLPEGEGLEVPREGRENLRGPRPDRPRRPELLPEN